MDEEAMETWGFIGNHVHARVLHQQLVWCCGAGRSQAGTAGKDCH